MAERCLSVTRSHYFCQTFSEAKMFQSDSFRIPSKRAELRIERDGDELRAGRAGLGRAGPHWARLGWAEPEPGGWTGGALKRIMSIVAIITKDDNVRWEK